MASANDKRTLAGWLALAALALAVVVLTYDLPDGALLALALAGFFAALATVGGFFIAWLARCKRAGMIWGRRPIQRTRHGAKYAAGDPLRGANHDRAIPGLYG